MAKQSAKIAKAPKQPKVKAIKKDGPKKAAKKKVQKPAANVAQVAAQ